MTNLSDQTEVKCHTFYTVAFGERNLNSFAQWWKVQADLEVHVLYLSISFFVCLFD